MFSAIFHTLFYNPIYNILILLIAHPWIDLGIAVIFVTIIVKLFLFPLTRSSIQTQIKLKEIEPKLNEIKEKYKNDKETQAFKTLELYQTNKINPFSSFFLILIQLPILFALYFVFLKGGLPAIDTSILYSFVKKPEFVNTQFLGILDVTQKSFFIALLAGITQYLQIKFTLPKIEEKKDGENTIKDDLMKNMHFQMKFILPIFIFIIAFGLPSAVGIYWVTSNIFMVGQELYIRKTVKNRR